MNELNPVAAMLQAEETWRHASACRAVPCRAVSAVVLQLLVAARKKHPRWGSRKLLVVAQRQTRVSSYQQGTDRVPR
jgi:hypothetical protein